MQISSNRGAINYTSRNHRGFYVVMKVPGLVRSLKGRAPEGMSQGCSRTSRGRTSTRTSLYTNKLDYMLIIMQLHTFCGGIIWIENLGRIKTSLKRLETSWSRSREKEGGTQCLGVGEEVVVAEATWRLYQLPLFPVWSWVLRVWRSRLRV
jgi:hypothetical protein